MCSQPRSKAQPKPEPKPKANKGHVQMFCTRNIVGTTFDAEKVFFTAEILFAA